MALAIAEVGLTFWNWPELKPALLEALTEVAGPRLVAYSCRAGLAAR